MHIRRLSSLLLAATTVAYAAADIDDTVSSGNFLIHLCNSDEPNSNASYLQQLLPEISSNVQAVIADARLGTTSKRGYGAFFKTDDNIEEVVKVFQRVATGTNSSRPTFVCINDIPETASVYRNCVYDHPNTPLVRWEESDHIALCPSFWNEKKVPVPKNDCPRLRGEILTPNNMALSLNQQAMIVHELVHMHQNATKYRDEVKNVRDAVNLDATASLADANNFALYYAAVHAGCNKWPITSQSSRPAPQNHVDNSESPLQASESASRTLAGIEHPTASTSAVPFHLEIRQDSCMSWAQAPNSSVCCDHNSGQWREPDIQQDDYAPGGPACVTQVQGVAQDGSPVYSDAPAPAAATTPVSYIQQDYCNGGMQLPNGTVCCDMSSGLWVEAPVVHDGPATDVVSAACPDPGSGQSEIHF